MFLISSSPFFQEKSKTYITAENIDKAIETSLNNVVDYSYAIDLAGNIYHGKDSIDPPTVTTPQKLQIQSIN